MRLKRILNNTFVQRFEKRKFNNCYTHTHKQGYFIERTHKGGGKYAGKNVSK